MKHYPKKLFHLIVFILTLLHAPSSFAEEIPFKLSYGLTENKFGTQINLNAGISKRSMRKTISLVSLKNDLIIKSISVNQGNVLFVDHVRPLPVSLNYGQQYDAYEDGKSFQSAVDEAAKIAQQRNLNSMETQYLQMQALAQAKEYQIIDIAIALDDGRTFFFEVGTDNIYLKDVRQNSTKQSIPSPPPTHKPTATQSVQQSEPSAFISELARCDYDTILYGYGKLLTEDYTYSFELDAAGDVYTYTGSTEDVLFFQLQDALAKTKVDEIGEKLILLFMNMNEPVCASSYISEYLYVQPHTVEKNDAYIVGVCIPETSDCWKLKIRKDTPLGFEIKRNGTLAEEGKICLVYSLPNKEIISWGVVKENNFNEN